jgi:hypothetical protein
MALQRRLVVAMPPFFDGDIRPELPPGLFRSWIPFRSCLARPVPFSAVE